MMTTEHLQLSPTVTQNAVATTNSTLLREIRRSETSLIARFHSIERDAALVLSLYEQLGGNLPLFGNARAGSWYVPPEISKTCSFKSADGHYGQWSLSLRRPNLHLLHHAIEAGGAVIVDTTRSGKRFPDALSKTIPIWCAAMTLLTNCSDCVESALHLPPFITPSERSHIVALLPQWLETWRSANVKLPAHLKLPIRPLWVTSGRPVWTDGLPSSTELGFIPIVCISASKPIGAIRKELPGRTKEITCCGVNFPVRYHSFAYVQGAGDDQENWSHGLAPREFWRYRDRIFACTPLGNEAVVSVVKEIVKEGFMMSQESADSTVTNCTGLSAARIEVRHSTKDTIPLKSPPGFGAVIILGVPKPNVDDDADKIDDNVWYFALRNRKGRVDQKYALCRALGDILNHLQDTITLQQKRVLVCGVGNGGKDAATAVAVAWVAWHCNEQMGVVNVARQREQMTKQCIHAAMLRLLAARADLGMSRAALQQVNRFFQSPSPPSRISVLHS